MNSIINVIEIIVIGLSILSLLFFIIKFLNSTSKEIRLDTTDIKINAYINRLDNIVKTSVIAINQTMVNPLKESNSFFLLDKEEAFESCKENIYKALQNNQKDLYTPYLSNLDEWINTRIEYYVKLNKTNI